MTETGSRPGERTIRGSVVLAYLLAVAAAAGCVGEQSGSVEEDAVDFDRSLIAADTTRGAIPDTVSPLRYRVFETRVESEGPLIVEYRLMALEEGRMQALRKTLRTVLDSIAVADTNLVAARAILYTYRPTGRREGRLTPSVWAEWAPISGWDNATLGSRAEPHRLFTYSERPDWWISDSGGS